MTNTIKAALMTESGNYKTEKQDYIYRKDSNFRLSRNQSRVYYLLSDGVPRSAADISAELRLSDPRSVIRCLRRRGIPVSDVWVQGAYGSRFKRYFIRKEAGNE